MFRFRFRADLGFQFEVFESLGFWNGVSPPSSALIDQHSKIWSVWLLMVIRF